MPMTRSARLLTHDERGLTLIELLVGIVLFALLLLAVDAVFISAHRAARKAELGADVQQNGRIAIERLTREIRETDVADITIDPGSGRYVAFKSARLPSDSSVFCVDIIITTSPLYNAACNATGNTFTPVWQRWIVYTYDAGAKVLRRQYQPLGSPPGPGGGDIIATSVADFDARCPGTSGLAGQTFCVDLEGEGHEVVQGSEVPPQRISLVSRVEIRN